MIIVRACPDVYGMRVSWITVHKAFSGGAGKQPALLAFKEPILREAESKARVGDAVGTEKKRRRT